VCRCYCKLATFAQRIADLHSHAAALRKPPAHRWFGLFEGQTQTNQARIGMAFRLTPRLPWKRNSCRIGQSLCVSKGASLHIRTTNLEITPLYSQGTRSVSTRTKCRILKRKRREWLNRRAQAVGTLKNHRELTIARIRRFVDPAQYRPAPSF